jgi:aromatic aminotransferase
MVTSGANQAFTNVTLTLLDPQDRAVLFLPYYFNHHMALQMALHPGNILYGECDTSTLKPSAQWLQQTLCTQERVKMVVVTNPCNPTGVLLGREELEELSGVCGAAGVWLVVDNTYEDFLFEGALHHCPSGPHVVHIFSFSKVRARCGCVVCLCTCGVLSVRTYCGCGGCKWCGHRHCGCGGCVWCGCTRSLLLW